MNKYADGETYAVNEGPSYERDDRLQWKLHRLPWSHTVNKTVIENGVRSERIVACCRNIHAANAARRLLSGECQGAINEWI